MMVLLGGMQLHGANHNMDTIADSVFIWFSARLRKHLDKEKG